MRQLRRAHRRAAFTVAAVLVGMCVLNAVMANAVPGLLAVPVIGPLTVGLSLLGLQSGATAWAAWWFGRYAKASLDPLARSLRSSAEASAGGR